MTTLRSRLRASGAIAAALVRRAVPAALMGAGLWACAAAPPAPKAHLRVVVERGTVAALPGRPSPQAVVLDLGRDPAPATAAARRRVAELQLRALPDDVPAWLVVVGGSGAEPCGAPRVYGPEPGEILAARAAALTPGSPARWPKGWASWRRGSRTRRRAGPSWWPPRARRAVARSIRAPRSGAWWPTDVPWTG